MRFEMTPKNIMLLSKVSKRIPDTTFSGWSRNVDMKFRDGFIYVYGRNTKEDCSLCVKKQDQNAEILIYPAVLKEKDANRQINELINSMDVGIYLHMEPDRDLEKAIISTTETLKA